MRGVIALMLSFASIWCYGQEEPQGSDRNQVVKFVLTPHLIYSNAYVFSYERTMKRNETLNITAGYVEFPQIFGGSNRFIVDRNNSKGGFTVGVDYRFYLKKENKYAAPRGVYLAPFISYYSFHNDRDIRDVSSATATDTRLVADVGFLNVGGQIGYQFVVNDRWTFDFIFFGPSITNYRLNLDLQGNYSVDQENDVVKELLDRFPLLKDLIDDKTVTLHGNNSKWAPGYRFSAMVGYKFGRKKK